MSHCTAPALGPTTTSLVGLYNDKMVDYVKLDRKTQEYAPCAQDKATHRLVPTKWNTPPRPDANIVKTLRAEKAQPRGYALSVIAQAL